MFKRDQMENTFGLKKNNWWCWEKKKVEVCPVPL